MVQVVETCVMRDVCVRRQGGTARGASKGVDG